MSETEKRVAIITGGSQGIGAGLVAAYRRQGWAVVANARSMKASADPEVLAVEGDISERATAQRIIGDALKRFARIDTLVNNAGVFVSKPFTDYTADDYALCTGVNLAGFFWITQLAIAEMLKHGSGHVSTSALASPSTRARGSQRCWPHSRRADWPQPPDHWPSSTRRAVSG
jgi:NAD(P)-dependent dehydrogenase (short-subunit alcohol dehydrogenase family)